MLLPSWVKHGAVGDFLLAFLTDGGEMRPMSGQLGRSRREEEERSERAG